MEIVKDYIKILDTQGKKFPQVVAIAQKIGIETGQLIAGAIVIWALFIILTMGGTILTMTLSVLYPAFKSVQALETKDTDDDDKIWLTYWCVFGGFTLLDDFFGFLLNMIPFYAYIKVGFFLWLMLPQTRGANTVYKSGLKPYLVKHKKEIEDFIKEI
jgi:receptor expression-enhancing protein 5/6